jgi:predicted ATP-dependent endonuclease of OLD family
MFLQFCQFDEELNSGQRWPVQFIITTHSNHLANEAPFEAIRYFMMPNSNDRYTIIKDLGEGFSGQGIDQDKEFLHKYLTLTRCDLFFADKAILVEGPTERILMPKMIEKVDVENTESKLASQYITLIEVGGAYVHHFYKLLDYLELRTLIITDLDSVKEVQSPSGSMVRRACQVCEGTHTSNAGIKSFFEGCNIESGREIDLSEITAKKVIDKEKYFRRIAYQIPEKKSKACGRSFEDAFMLANQNMFELKGKNDIEKASDAYEKAKNIEKTNFAITYALVKTNWIVPKYIKEGLQWLAKKSPKSLAYGTRFRAEEEAAVDLEVK